MANAKNEPTALNKYEAAQDNIRRLLKQIQEGVHSHDRNASTSGGHHWGHVGDLADIEDELKDIRDRLHGMGEYAKVEHAPSL